MGDTRCIRYDEEEEGSFDPQTPSRIGRRGQSWYHRKPRFLFYYEKKARRTSQDESIDETLLFDDNDDDENYTEHEYEGSELDSVMQPFLHPPNPEPEGKTEEEENTKHSPRHFTPQKYSSELEAELTKLREEMSKKMLPDDFDSSLAEYNVNLGLDGHMPDAVIGSVLDEGSTYAVLFVMQEITLLGVCHGLYSN